MKKDKSRCVACGSKQTYVRLETKDRVCRSCGEIKPIESKAKALPSDQGDNLDVSKGLIP